MKELARFQGKVTKFNPPPEPSYVTLKNLANNEVADTSAISEILLKNGIDHDECDFEVIIIEDEFGKPEAQLKKLLPKELSKETLDEIKKNMPEDGLFDI